MPSSPQTIATQLVFDYLTDSQGKAIPNKLVQVTLDYAFANNISPVVFVVPLTVTTATDSNGYWQVPLVPNPNITPLGTTYSVEIPGQTQYQISVPSGGGPFQSSSILVNQPSVLSPATTNLTGPLTVTGNETVTGNLTVQGSTSLGVETAGATTLGTTQVQGDLTIASTFRLLFGAAVSKIVPGATSFSIRNNADAADNLLVTNAGDIVVAAGRLLISATAAKILGGVTSLSLRNNADSADNFLLTDAGLATLRNALSIPTTAGGSITTTSYGSLPIKIDEQTPSGVATISVTIPSWARMVETIWAARSSVAANTDNLKIRYNNDTGANYNWVRSAFFAAYASTGPNNGTTSAEAGLPTGANSPASQFAGGTIKHMAPNSTGFARMYTSILDRTDAGVAASGPEMAAGNWGNTANAISTITYFLLSGNYASGSLFVTYAYP